MNNREEDIHILCIVENIDAVGAKAISRKIAFLGQRLMNFVQIYGRRFSFGVKIFLSLNL